MGWQDRSASTRKPPVHGSGTLRAWITNGDEPAPNSTRRFARNWMTRSELAWELADLFTELKIDQINEMLAKNVPLETLEFFNAYGQDFGKSEGIEGNTLQRLPNLLLLGYILRVLEERLLEGDEPSEH